MDVTDDFVKFSDEIDVGVLVVMGLVKLLALLVGVGLFVEIVLLIVVTGTFVDFSEKAEGVLVVMN